MTKWTEADWHKPPMSVGEVNRSGASRQQKYRNEKCVYNGQNFDSLKEMEDYKAFKLEELSGAIRAVVRQVSFPLQGSTRRVRVDFMVVAKDLAIRFVDSKGHATKEWLLKQKLVLDVYGIRIETI